MRPGRQRSRIIRLKRRKNAKEKSHFEHEFKRILLFMILEKENGYEYIKRKEKMSKFRAYKVVYFTGKSVPGYGFLTRELSSICGKLKAFHVKKMPFNVKY